MNYREFTERVYNYKHGLTNSAESQNIEHSAKQTEEINENEHIEHSGQGQTWDQHKYIRKEYLGNGNWRYIYEDGSSNVTNAANEKEADVKEGAYQTNKAYGNGAQNTNYQTSAGAKMSSNTDFTQARKDMYKELGEKARDYNKQLEGFQGVAKGLAQSNADQEAAKLKIQAGNIANNLGASQKETEDRKMYVDLENKARDYNKQLEGFQGVTKSLEQSNADQAESARQLEKEALASKAQARSDRYDKMGNLDVNTSATPLNQLTNQGAAATQEANRVTENNAKNEAAKSAMNNYVSQIKSVSSELSNAGLSDDELVNLIRTTEKLAMGESIIDQIKEYDPSKQNMVFMAGAEEAFNEYASKVVPTLRAYLNNFAQNSGNSEIEIDRNAQTPEPMPLSERKYDNASTEKSIRDIIMNSGVENWGRELDQFDKDLYTALENALKPTAGANWPSWVNADVLEDIIYTENYDAYKNMPARNGGITPTYREAADKHMSQDAYDALSELALQAYSKVLSDWSRKINQTY